MKDKELSEREMTVTDIEKAVREESCRRRAKEQEEHEKLMHEAEQYKEEQRSLAERQRAEISKETEEHKKSIERIEKSKFRAFKVALTGYLIFLTVFLFGLSVFSIIRQKVFCTDFVNFFKSVPSQVMAGVKKIANLIPIESNVVQWVVLAVVVLIALVVLYMLYIGASENVGMWYLSFMAFLLALVVFFGEEIKPLINDFNLFGAWLITFMGSVTAWTVFVKVREMRNGVIQDREKNIILFIGLTLLALFILNIVL